MKKIIIIDDRKERKKQFLKDDKDIEELSKYVDFKESFGNDSAESILEEVKDYELIAIHRSWLLELGDNAEKDLIDFVEDKKKYLVLFSGGIDQKLIQENFIARVNSADFYTKWLIEFSKRFNEDENMKSPLAQLLYGESWKLLLWTDLRAIYWKYEDDLNFEKLKEEFGDEEGLKKEDEIKEMFRNLDLKDNNFNEWNVEKITKEIEKIKYYYHSI